MAKALVHLDQFGVPPFRFLQIGRLSGIGLTQALCLFETLLQTIMLFKGQREFFFQTLIFLPQRGIEVFQLLEFDMLGGIGLPKALSLLKTLLQSLLLFNSNRQFLFEAVLKSDRLVKLFLCLIQLKLQLVREFNGFTETISPLLRGLELQIKGLDPEFRLSAALIKLRRLRLLLSELSKGLLSKVFRLFKIILQSNNLLIGRFDIINKLFLFLLFFSQSVSGRSQIGIKRLDAIIQCDKLALLF